MFCISDPSFKNHFFDFWSNVFVSHPQKSTLKSQLWGFWASLGVVFWAIDVDLVVIAVVSSVVGVDLKVVVGGIHNPSVNSIESIETEE